MILIFLEQTCTTAGRRTFECSIACEKVEDWAVNGPLISRGSGTSASVKKWSWIEGILVSVMRGM